MPAVKVGIPDIDNLTGQFIRNGAGLGDLIHLLHLIIRSNIFNSK